MDRQDIIRQFRNKRPDLPPRLNYEQELKTIVQGLTSEKEQEFVGFVTPDGNIRQKLKTFKRIIDGGDEKEAGKREFCVEHLTAFHLKEYIFGQVESKPVLMNTLKRIHQLRPYQAGLLAAIIQPVPLESYTECRYLL